MASRGTRSKADTNAAILKKLLKDSGNKYCCDCKTADHPRWASWNLGIFLCIRCSGIHRSMGTHISRVKSVDLDAWTDEQTQSMILWGNTKANKYWEAKLARDHVPSDGKIDNFVKTKYVSRRWTSQPDRPDPEALSDDEGNEPIPTAVKLPVQENTTRTARPARPFEAAAPLSSLLDFGSEPQQPVAGNAASTAPQGQQATLDFQQEPPKPDAAKKTNLSLLSNAVPATSAQNNRNDLKMSIMSLYASAPRNQAPSRSARNEPHQNDAFCGSQQTAPSRDQGGMNDLSGLFGNVSFAPPLMQSQAAPNNARSNFESPAPSAAAHPAWQSSVPAASATDDWANGISGGPSTTKSAMSSTKQTSAFDDLYSTSDVWK
ncbi:putative GTPase activating protein for Arf-domain-containing protein [Protomyces lactucae-debilis]|uniref:Putative GTPase activating protein for Arf-domain-containing protein n=1 Tax=Protomyces lactucae-debilis TaxID=2754530 RepID=A0A1Y2FCH9_PROLT|nr:putative GTPase activating protein for Arf-domain-containing protein [Protomyces lactucae-debilis]ORY81611.1 putative GTPase activating protein for Arf-domain-containing protein [Protomyces lactucae-debilis]